MREVGRGGSVSYVAIKIWINREYGLFVYKPWPLREKEIRDIWIGILDSTASFQLT